MGRTKRRRSIKCCKANKSDGDIINLKQWMSMKRFNLKVVSFKGAGRGVVSNKNIKAGEELIGVPLQCMITLDVVSKSLISQVFGAIELKPQVAISLFLIYQKHMGQAAMFANYINVLPKSFCNLLTCCEQEMKSLPPWIQKTVLIKLNELKENFNEAVENMSDNQCDHCKFNSHQIFTYKEFLWAWFAVNTRAVYYVDDVMSEDGEIKPTPSMAMAPFLDFINHSNDADVEAKLDCQRGVYSLTTKKPFPKYNQIFIKYGAYSNLKLLVEYGFILNDMDQDVVEFSLQEVLEAAKKVSPRYADISKLKYKFITMNNLNTTLNKSIDEFSWNCNGLLYILITQDTNLAEILSKTYSSTWSEKEEVVMKEIKQELMDLKSQILKNELAAMERIEACSEGFALAKDLVKQYIRILNN